MLHNKFDLHLIYLSPSYYSFIISTECFKNRLIMRKKIKFWQNLPIFNHNFQIQCLECHIRSLPPRGQAMLRGPSSKAPEHRVEGPGVAVEPRQGFRSQTRPTTMRQVGGRTRRARHHPPEARPSSAGLRGRARPEQS